MITGAELDICPTFGWQGGPELNTMLKQLRSGHERRRPLWQHAKHRFSLPFLNIKNAEYLLHLKSVFLAAGGRAQSFLVKDYSDFSADNAVFGAGDGATTEFDLLLQYTFGDASYTRLILWPVDPTFRVNGVMADATYDYQKRKVVFATAPPDLASLTWSGEHRLIVRFDSDYLPMSIDNKTGQSYVMNGSVDLVEVWE